MNYIGYVDIFHKNTVFTVTVIPNHQPPAHIITNLFLNLEWHYRKYRVVPAKLSYYINPLL